jgi:trigger factor
LTFTTKKLKDSQVELTVDLNKDDLILYTIEAEKGLAKEIKVEGFRLGKAPKEIVRKKIGEQVIKEEALNLAVQSSLAKALAEQKLDVLDQSDFKIKENSTERLMFTVNLLVVPEVRLGEYKNLSIKKNPVKIMEAEISAVFDDIVKSRTILKDVERPARIGDRVEVDFEVKDPTKGLGQAAIIEGGKSENHPVVLGEEKFVPGFESRIIGLKPGEKKNFSLKVPGDYYQKSIAGKDIDFEVVLKKVQEMAVPKVDDELAKSLGRFTSKADLETNIRDGLIMEKETKEKERIRLAILKEIAGKTEVETPPALIEKRLDSMTQGFDNELHQKGMELGLYLAHMKKTQDELRRDRRKQAEAQVKFDLIVRTIANEEHLKVSDEEVGQELQTVLQQYMMAGSPDGGGGPTAPEALQNIDPEQLKNRISSVLLNEKVFEFLEKHNKFS